MREVNSKLIQRPELNKHYSYTGMPEGMQESLLGNDFEEKKEEKIECPNAFTSTNFRSDLDMARAL